MGFERYATLGHSYGAFVVLQHAVDRPGDAGGHDRLQRRARRPASSRAVEENLAAFEPVELREQVTQSWAREAEAQTQEDCDALLHDQLPFHFGDPRDPRIEEFERRTAGRRLRARRAAPLRGRGLRRDRGRGPPRRRSPIPVLVLAGRHDRTCVVEGGEAIAGGIPGAQLTVFEASGHLTFAEENEAYLLAVRRFLQSVP